MKTIFLLTMSCGIVLLSSCKNDQTSQGVYGQTIVEKSPLQLQVEEDSIRRIMLRDIMNREAAIADSINKEKERRLDEEDQERKLLIAKDKINALSNELMKEVSFITGKKMSYEILFDESSYDRLTRTMKIVFRTSWDAITDFNPDSPYETHIFTGMLTLYGTGESSYEQISQNDVLRRAITANKTADELVKLLDKFSNKQ